MFQNLSRNALLSRGRLLVAFLLFGLNAYAQTIAVKGHRHVAADNGSLPGVNIVVKNTLAGTTTDAEGKFEINAPSDAHIDFLWYRVRYPGNFGWPAKARTVTILNLQLIPNFSMR
jgi:hypothetical protein